jgi:hypothetical protein
MTAQRQEPPGYEKMKFMPLMRVDQVKMYFAKGSTRQRKCRERAVEQEMEVNNARLASASKVVKVR